MDKLQQIASLYLSLHESYCLSSVLGRDK
jgi:hypothetical protein